MRDRIVKNGRRSSAPTSGPLAVDELVKFRYRPFHSKETILTEAEMSQDVVILHFPGDPEVLLAAYAEAARRWQASGGVAPETVVTARGETGLLVTLVWGPGVGHDGFGAHVQRLLEPLALPFPRVDHGLLATADWSTLVDLAANATAS